MISYDIQLSGPVPFTVELSFNARRVPMLDVVGFGDRNKVVHGKLVSGMIAARFALPYYCQVSGPGPEVFREIFAPGFPLGLLVELMDAAQAQVSGQSTPPRYAWGDIVDGVAVPAAGELAVALEISQQHPGVEFIVPRYLCYPSEQESLGEVLQLTASVVPQMGLDRLNKRTPLPRVPRVQKISEPPPSIELDGPLLIKLAVEVGIAARLPTALIGCPSALDGWAAYARACMPQLATETLLEHEAMRGFWPSPSSSLAGLVPCEHVGPETTHDELVGEIDISADPPGAAGLLVQAHHGLLLVEQTGFAYDGSRARVADSVLRRIAASSLRFAGEERQLRHTVITSMPACACDPPRDLPCRCAGVHAPLIARQRRRVSSWGVGICVWGDGSRGRSQPTLDADMSSGAVRARIARAWATQDAELGVGVRWGEQGGRSGDAGELVSKALTALGFGSADVAVLTPLLATRPW